MKHTASWRTNKSGTGVFNRLLRTCSYIKITNIVLSLYLHTVPSGLKHINFKNKNSHRSKFIHIVYVAYHEKYPYHPYNFTCSNILVYLPLIDMYQLLNDTTTWDLIDVPPPSVFIYNSNTYEAFVNNTAAGNYMNSVILPVPSLVNIHSISEETSAANYWALILIFFPIFTIVGNVLVIISVYKEKSLHTVTNYFVVSLAISDITVAAVVMPFAIYLEFNRVWDLSDRLCDFWVASDCMACTASILNLVAIAVDRYIAVTKPLKYARHKSPQRVAIMVVIVWVTSFCIALPIVSGVNKSDVSDYPRVAEQCAFFNNKFLIFSSLGSFFIPCVIIFGIYYRIFMVIRGQARKNRKQFRPKVVLESAAAQYRSNADNLITSYYNERSRDISHESPVLATDVYEEVSMNANATVEHQRNSIMLKLSTPMLSPRLCPLTSATSVSSEHIDEEEHDDISLFSQQTATNENDTIEHDDKIGNITSPNKNGNGIAINKIRSHFRTKQCISKTDDRYRRSHFPIKRMQLGLRANLGSTNVTVSARLTTSNNTNRVAKRKAYSRMKKERKATQTLIIVLICFLVCWLPFFVLNNIVNAFVKLSKRSSAFLINDFILFLCVWLGYINSFLNPIIYTLFNLEFRKAFSKIIFTTCRF